MSKDVTLLGRRVLILGAIDTLALAIARTFTQAGASLNFAFSQSEGDNSVARIGESGLTPLRLRALDFAVPEHLNAQLRSFEPLDIIVFIPRWSVFKPVMDTEAVDIALEQNVLEAGFVLQALTNYFRINEPLQSDALQGRIIVPLSVLAQIDRPKSGLLGASHAALAALCRQAAVELALCGVTLNTVLTHVENIWQPGEYVDAPLTQQGSVQDVSEACRYLASEAGRYLTGTSLTVDGGYSLTRRAHSS